MFRQNLTILTTIVGAVNTIDPNTINTVIQAIIIIATWIMHLKTKNK